MSFGIVAVLAYDCDYGSLKIGDSGNVTGNSDYMHTSVEKLRGTGDFDMDYGSLKINNMTANAGDISIESDYMKTTIGYSPDYNFNFNSNSNIHHPNTNQSPTNNSWIII